VELTEQPVVEKEANVASSTPQKDDAIGKSTLETENKNQDPTEHSNVHHLDCLQLQEVENCALTVESTASLAQWLGSCIPTRSTRMTLKSTLKPSLASRKRSFGITSGSDIGTWMSWESLALPNLSMPLNPKQIFLNEAQMVDLI